MEKILNKIEKLIKMQEYDQALLYIKEVKQKNESKEITADKYMDDLVNNLK